MAGPFAPAVGRVNGPRADRGAAALLAWLPGPGQESSVRHRVYLVPGFFGFANLGDLAYFGHVRDELRRAFAARGAALEVHAVVTWPTASLRRRAARLLETIGETVQAGDIVHVIGHSSGGLDARLALTPAVSLPTGADVEAVAARVRSLVTVATPHRGTPVAAFFAGLMGQKALQVLSLATMYVLRFGRLPLGAVLRLGAAFAWLDGQVGVNSLLLDQLFEQLLGDFSRDRRDAIARLLADVERDRALLPQLAPEAMDVFDALVRERAGLRRACVVTQASPPGVISQLGVGLDPSAHATHLVYQGLYRIAAQGQADLAGRADERQRDALRRGLGALPGPEANDGVVPTWSQLDGEVLAAVRADHLDVLGHYRDPQAVPPRYDWLTTGSGFDTPTFRRVWDVVAGFLVSEQPSGAEDSPPGPSTAR